MEWAQLPISMEEFQERTKVHQEKWFPTTKPLKGVEDLLASLSAAKRQGDINMAVATSSHKRNFDLKTGHLGHIISHFDPDHIVVGDDPRIGKGRGKPAPDIYLLALQLLNAQLPASQVIHPEECLVFEDSVPGVEAGRRAGMQVAWVPHEGLLDIYQTQVKHVLAGLTGEHPEDDSEEGKNADAEWERKREEWVAQGREFARVRGRTGELDDGWGRLFSSLEEFPLDYYGIGSGGER